MKDGSLLFSVIAPSVVLALVLVAGLAFAQDAPMDGLPANTSPAERCRIICHRQHCDSWSSCYQLPDQEQKACHERVNKDEARCMNNCDLG